MAPSQQDFYGQQDFSLYRFHMKFSYYVVICFYERGRDRQKEGHSVVPLKKRKEFHKK